ncbi:MAG TPA: hypothetical protein DCE42_06615 [Myxococcales bacterium]|nr:hypothetical protein [Myxococcales bacterium]
MQKKQEILDVLPSEQQQSEAFRELLDDILKVFDEQSPKAVSLKLEETMAELRKAQAQAFSELLERM